MKKERRQRSKMNIPMCAACVLLCLTMFSIYLMSGLYAKYVVKADGGDSARVATIGEVTFTETGSFTDPEHIIVTPGVNLTKDARVSYSGGEVAVYVFVKIDLSDNWEVVNGRNYSVEISGHNDLLNWFLYTDWNYLTGTEYVCYQEVDPNAKLSDCPIIMDNGKINVTSDISKDSLISELNNEGKGTYINFTTYVVQAGGFDSAKQAWESVKDK